MKGGPKCVEMAGGVLEHQPLSVIKSLLAETVSFLHPLHACV